MPQQANQSDVARLLEQIQAEYRAAQRGLTGFAETARHDFITARLENVSRLHEELHALVGEDATRLIVEHEERL